MGTPFTGEIKPFSFSFAPDKFALCNGKSLPVDQNAALFLLIGAAFGGDGSTTFNLPDLRSRVPVGADTSQGLPQGHRGGVETVILSVNEMANHSHRFSATAEEANALSMDADADDVLATASGSPGGDPAQPVYIVSPSPGAVLTLSPNSGTLVGGGAAHPNIQPTSVINFCIALTGIYPQTSG